ncbi:uncharacterized protein LOC6543707 [Drosophila erecta]|uniref:Uncharacterized protein n=1 Tax=Drosophila erecta TaxID=7220 RepID=B3NC52_DROER|nr:uncharacterized protein LOC6543707 [Drosophila erecta]EDV50940.1 uncharacterized protein Dere_GG14179 [Drosophila erecta]
MAVLRIYFLLLFCLHLSQSIKVDSGSKEGVSSSTQSPPVYRVSKPEPKKPENRVPPHLQDIRPGYVDDDAGDVIRIIEPPQHFQQLKRLRLRQPHNPPVVWEQPRKLATNRVKIMPQGDLLTQETQIQNGPNQLQIPMEILASVRKTERLLQRQRQKAKFPLVRQRYIQRQSHTLIAQKALEQQLYQRGQQQRLKAVFSRNQELKRSKRNKRDVAAKPKEPYDVQKGLKLVAHIGDLLKNATQFLPDEGVTNEVKRSPICSNAATCDNRRRRERLFKQQAKSAEREKLKERRRNFRNKEATTITAPTTKATTATTTTGKSVFSSANSLAEASATPLASRLVNSRKSKSQSPNNNRNSHWGRSDDSILYADVMTNIRNLWQEHDQLAAPKFIAPGEVANNTDYRALDVYLKQLDDLAKKLPTVAPISGLNKEELQRATPTPSWYLINSEGGIFETRLDSQTKPSSSLFHRFPDMPSQNQSVSTLDLE